MVRYIKCEKCSIPICSYQYVNHSKFCDGIGDMKRRCDTCDKRINNNNFKKHKKKCPSVTVRHNVCISF